MQRNWLGLARLSHACDTVRHTPASLMRSRASTPRFVASSFSVISQAASATAMLPKTWTSEPGGFLERAPVVAASPCIRATKGLDRLAPLPAGRQDKAMRRGRNRPRTPPAALPGRPTKAPNCRQSAPDRRNIGAVLVGSHDGSLPSAGRAVGEQLPIETDRRMYHGKPSVSEGYLVDGRHRPRLALLQAAFALIGGAQAACDSNHSGAAVAETLSPTRFPPDGIRCRTRRTR